MTEKIKTESTGQVQYLIVRVCLLLIVAGAMLSILLGFGMLLNELEESSEITIVNAREAPAEEPTVSAPPAPAEDSPPPVIRDAPVPVAPLVTFPSPAPASPLIESETIQEESHLLHLTTGESLSFSCGEGVVTIHFRDGGVEYFNCDPQTSGKAFWEAVSKAFPEFKESIRRDKR